MAYDDTPDLDALGRPVVWNLKLPDGTVVPYEHPQTKRDNCITLASKFDSPDQVSHEVVGDAESHS